MKPFSEQLTQLCEEYHGKWRYIKQSDKLIIVEVMLPEDKKVIFQVKNRRKG